MTARHYCCYFDHRYLSRGLAMIRSLRRFDRSSPIWVLALTDECRRILETLEESNVRVVPLARLEEGDADLLRAKTNRSLIEYYFTLTPSLVRYVMRHAEHAETVTYVDGDLYFFEDPEPLHRELGEGHVAIVEHRFAPFLKHLERYGKYNVSWVSFRNSVGGREIAEWWRERCNEWCYDFVEEDRFGDQKYLERFAELFDGVVVLQHEGANVAPWNLASYDVTSAGEQLLVRPGVPVIFFHFHGLKALTSWLYVSGHTEYRVRFRGVVRNRIYTPYVSTLVAIERELEVLKVPASGSLGRSVSSLKSWPHRVLSALLRTWRDLTGLVRGEAILVVGSRAI